MNNKSIILCNYLEAKDILYNYRLQKNAGLIDSIKESFPGFLNELVDYVFSLYDPNHPVASIVNIAMPALLDMIPGVGWIMGFLWSLAEAFGFDTKAFVSNLGTSLESILEEAFKTKNIDVEKIQKAATDAAVKSFTGPVDAEKAEKLIAEANKINTKLIKNAGIFSWLSKLLIGKSESAASKIITGNPAVKKGIIGKIGDIIGWIFGKIFGGLWKTIFVAGATIPFGHEPGKQIGESKDTSEVEKTEYVKLTPAPSIKQEYLETHLNDDYHIWSEDFPITNIENEVIKWTTDIYPQLKGKENLIEKSSNFKRLIDYIRSKNKKMTGHNLTFIPKDYSRKLDIVNTFINDIKIGE